MRLPTIASCSWVTMLYTAPLAGFDPLRLRDGRDDEDKDNGYNECFMSNSDIVSDPEIMNGTRCFQRTRRPSRTSWKTWRVVTRSVISDTRCPAKKLISPSELGSKA